MTLDEYVAVFRRASEVPDGADALRLPRWTEADWIPGSSSALARSASAPPR